MYDLNEMTEALKGLISSKRFSHSLHVSELAEELARIHGVDPEKAKIAGLLHDCARDYTDKQLMNVAQANQMMVGELERDIPVLLHGQVGAVVCRDYFGVLDADILRAISAHTTGTPFMDKLDKVLFLADKCADGRSYPGVEEVRNTAFKNLAEGMTVCLQHTMQYYINRRQPIHPDMLTVWNQLWYRNRDYLKYK